MEEEKEAEKWTAEGKLVTCHGFYTLIRSGFIFLSCSIDISAKLPDARSDS